MCPLPIRDPAPAVNSLHSQRVNIPGILLPFVQGMNSGALRQVRALRLIVELHRDRRVGVGRGIQTPLIPAPSHGQGTSTGPGCSDPVCQQLWARGVGKELPAAAPVLVFGSGESPLCKDKLLPWRLPRWLTWNTGELPQKTSRKWCQYSEQLILLPWDPSVVSFSRAEP